MANEFKHVSVGTDLSQAEWESTAGHVLNSQATGDVIYASSASQLTRLGIGATGTIFKVTGGLPVWFAKGTSLQVLRTNSGATDLEWATISSPPWVLVANGTFTNASNLNPTSLSGYKRYRLTMVADGKTGGPIAANLQINGNTSTNYAGNRLRVVNTTVSGQANNITTSFTVLDSAGHASSYNYMTAEIMVQQNDANDANFTYVGAEWNSFGGSGTDASTANNTTVKGGGTFLVSGTITSLMVNFTGVTMNGNYILEGSNS